MPVKIRLSRVGRKHVPMYRVVAVDSRKKRDGAVLDMLGTFDAINSTVIKFDQELYNSWIAKGAIPSDSAKKVYRLFKKTAQSAAKLAEPAKPKTATKAEKKEAPKAAQEKKTEIKAAEQPNKASASETAKK